ATPITTDRPLSNRSSRRNSADEIVSRYNLVSPFGAMLNALREEAVRNGIWCDELHRDLPKRWEKHGDLIIFPPNCFKHHDWRLIGRRLWQLTARSLKAERLGRKRIIDGDDFHTPHVDLLYGKDGWVEHVDNGVRYQYDVTKRMFSSSNISEKQRISEMDCHREVVVDMFAGIGYFTMAYLMNAHAKHVYAIDWHEDAVEALKKTLECNGITDRCTVIYGDARRVSPHGVADRVNMGLVPSSRPYWLTGCRCLKSTGGILHIHEAIKLKAAGSDENKKGTYQLRRLRKSGSTLSRNESLGSVDEESELSEHTEKCRVDQNDNVILSKNGHQFVKANGEPMVTHTEEQAEMKTSDESDQKRLKRKISRSASIIEEIEKRILPNARIEPDFKANIWASLDAAIRDFAFECATKYFPHLFISFL
uniref:tRNA(Phe) (4-demethylwyosine(37)-C(7)) aminocarboxypropyltransferase n=1 Tax=Parascaris univalens TaxID=6257 RepID=A0A915C1V2_PARUN